MNYLSTLKHHFQWVVILGLGMVLLIGCSSKETIISDPRKEIPAEAEACDETMKVDHYLDSDGDGYGDPNEAVKLCYTVLGYVQQGGDCDDEDPSVFPWQSEVVGNGKDDDCNSSTNDDGTCTSMTEICDGLDNYFDQNVD